MKVVTEVPELGCGGTEAVWKEMDVPDEAEGEDGGVMDYFSFLCVPVINYGVVFIFNKLLESSPEVDSISGNWIRLIIRTPPEGTLPELFRVLFWDSTTDSTDVHTAPLTDVGIKGVQSNQIAPSQSQIGTDLDKELEFKNDLIDDKEFDIPQVDTPPTLESILNEKEIGYDQ
ncbi:hypothetical protein STEG23_013858 [Scotinomys teguina]